MSDQISSTPVTTGPDYVRLRQRLWDAAIDGDEYTAVMIVFSALDAAITPEDILLEVIAPVQLRVGTEWAANRITVAQEHTATAINDRVIAVLANHPAGVRKAQRSRVTVACVDGEWHALPARLVAEVLRLRGWQVDFLGAQVPTPHLIAHIHERGPAVVALSCSIPTRLPTAHAAITACQAAGVPVLVGGAAFGPDGRYARLLRASAWAPDARSAAQLLDDGLAPVDVPSLHQPVDDLPHLTDQEFTMVRGSAARLVRATVAGLTDRFPAMRSYSAAQIQHTTDDIGHIIEFLVAALYIDDDDLFTGFIRWTAHILDARGVPARSLLPALDLLGTQLPDFPRAQRLLAAARDALMKEQEPTA